MANIGITLPIATPDHTPDTVLRCARMAEDAGAHSLWTIDRLAFGNQEPLLGLAAAAALTTRVKLGTSVLLGTLRGAAMLAKQIATLDQLSNGRVILGLGVGSRPDDFAANQIPFEQRGRRAEELIDILRLSWSGAPVKYDGQIYQIDVGPIGPKPVQEHLPIWLGGSAEAALSRAGRVADGFISGASRGAVGFTRNIEKVREAAAAAGRDPSTINGSTLAFVSLDDHMARARERAFAYQANYYSPERADPDQCILGSVEQCLEKVGPYLEAGSDPFILSPVTADLDHFERICKNLLPRLAAM